LVTVRARLSLRFCGPPAVTALVVMRKGAVLQAFGAPYSELPKLEVAGSTPVRRLQLQSEIWL